MLLSEIFPLKLRIVSSDPFPDVSYRCVTCVCNNCHEKNQSRRSKMGLTSHLSSAYDTFSYSLFYFSLLLSPMTMYPMDHTMKVLGPGSLPFRAFLHVLNYSLIVLMDYGVK